MVFLLQGKTPQLWLLGNTQQVINVYMYNLVVGDTPVKMKEREIFAGANVIKVYPFHFQGNLRK